jgi:hypothetical protein
VFSYGESINKGCFSNKDIVNIKLSLVGNKLKLKDDGCFLDFKTYQPTKSFLVRKMKEKGAVYIFPNKEFYVFFLRYLDELIGLRDFHSLINREVKYKGPDGKIYSFLIKNNTLTIYVKILSPIDIEGFPYSESSYMYSFERVDGVVMLAKINVAG